MTDNDIIGIVTGPVEEPHEWNVSDPIHAGTLVYVDTRRSGTVAMMTSKGCCELCEEMDKVSVIIQKKIIALLRLAGSKIKVNWIE